MPVETVLMVSFMVAVKWHGICFAELVYVCSVIWGCPISNRAHGRICHYASIFYHLTALSSSVMVYVIDVTLSTELSRARARGCVAFRPLHLIIVSASNMHSLGVRCVAVRMNYTRSACSTDTVSY